MVMIFSQIPERFRLRSTSYVGPDGLRRAFAFGTSEQPTLVEEEALRVWARARWTDDQWNYQPHIGTFQTNDPDIALEFKMRWC